MSYEKAKILCERIELMNACEWTKNEYVNLAKVLESAEVIESHPCKFRIIEHKTVKKDKQS